MKKVHLIPQDSDQSIMDVMYGDKKIGEAYPSETGFYDFDHTGTGTLSSWALRQIADALDEINAPWEKKLTEDFDRMRQSDSNPLDVSFLNPVADSAPEAEKTGV